MRGVIDYASSLGTLSGVYVIMEDRSGIYQRAVDSKFPQILLSGVQEVYESEGLIKTK